MFRAALAAVLLAAAPASAAPRDELLRVAPPDAALVVVVQNARDHARTMLASPFAEWFPSTALGKKLLDSAEFKQLREFGTVVLPAVGTTPEALLDDVLGDAVGFAYSPGPPDKPNDERAVILVRPRKPEALAKIIDTLNDIQKKNNELKGVAARTHDGAEYFERQRPDGTSEFYCFRDGVFAFSSSEADVKAVIDRSKAAPKDGDPELVARMKKLGVADAAAVVLINPRALDAEVKARVAAARPDEKRFVERFAEVWAGLESAAVSASLDADLELALSLRFHPEKLPADLRKWLVGPREGGAPAALIPEDALFGVAGHVRAAELLDLVATVAPAPAGRPGVKELTARTLGPVVGRNNLPLVLESLGPNWAAWAEPPAKDSYLPTLVAAVEVSGEGEKRAKAEKALVEAVGFGFRALRVAYNMRHEDQIELKEEKDEASGATITTLVNDKAFPPGFRPSFALTRGYLVLSTSPEAVKRFRPPASDGPSPQGSTTLARLSGVRSREYLRDHGEKLAKFLANLGIGDEKRLRGYIENLSAVLELVDSAELTSRDIENGLRLAVKVKPAKPLKK